jgi:lysophospholipase L1-like esterase
MTAGGSGGAAGSATTAGTGGASTTTGDAGVAGTTGSAGTAGTTGGGGKGMGGSAGSGGSPPNDGGPGNVAAGVRWVGRVDVSDPAKPKFGWSGTGFVASVSGTSITVNLNNADAFFFQPVVDGKKGTRFRVAAGTATHQIATGLSNGVHTLELYRETEAAYGVSQFLGITEGALMSPPPAPGRLIEFVGDSITAGYGNLGAEPHPNNTDPMPCLFTFDTESAYMSYGAVAARALSADASLIAASGWGIYRDFNGNTSRVVSSVYANTLGYTAPPTWDFKIKPDVVAINLGTNDFYPGDPGAMYTSALGAFVDTVRSKYPSAWIFCVLGSMLEGAQHDQAKSYMQSIVQSHNGDVGKIAFVDLGTQNVLNGTGCDTHPNTTEDQRMADLLVAAIKPKLGW